MWNMLLGATEKQLLNRSNVEIYGWTHVLVFGELSVFFHSWEQHSICFIAWITRYNLAAFHHIVVCFASH